MLCIINSSIKQQSFIYTQLNVKTVLFLKSQLNINSQFSSIWPIDRTISGATTPGQRGPGNDGNRWVLCIPQSFRFTGAAPLDCLLSYPGHSFEESYLSVEIKLVYSAADRANRDMGRTKSFGVQVVIVMWAGTILFGLVSIGFFVEWHTKHRGLFNVKDILVERH